MNNYIKEVRAVLILLGVGSLFFLLVYLISRFDLEFGFIKYFVLYIVIFVILTLLGKVLKNNIFNKIINVILFPGGIILVLGILIIPFLKLIKNIVIYFLLVFSVSYFLFYILQYFNLIESSTLVTYLNWTFIVFISVLFNFQIRRLINYTSPNISDSSDKILKDKEISDYLLSENNIRFIIYVIYIFVLIFNNISSFQIEASNQNPDNNKAILQSFVTFIAFERALSLLKTLEFKPSDLLNKISGAISNHLKDLNK